MCNIKGFLVLFIFCFLIKLYILNYHFFLLQNMFFNLIKSTRKMILYLIIILFFSVITGFLSTTLP